MNLQQRYWVLLFQVDVDMAHHTYRAQILQCDEHGSSHRHAPSTGIFLGTCSHSHLPGVESSAMVNNSSSLFQALVFA